MEAIFFLSILDKHLKRRGYQKLSSSEWKFGLPIATKETNK